METVITRLTLKDGADEEWDATMTERMRAVEHQDAGSAASSCAHPISAACA